MTEYIIDFLIVLVLPTTTLVALLILNEKQPEGLGVPIVLALWSVTACLALLRVISWFVNGARLT